MSDESWIREKITSGLRGRVQADDFLNLELARLKRII